MLLLCDKSLLLLRRITLLILLRGITLLILLLGQLLVSLGREIGGGLRQGPVRLGVGRHCGSLVLQRLNLLGFGSLNSGATRGRRLRFRRYYNGRIFGPIVSDCAPCTPVFLVQFVTVGLFRRRRSRSNCFGGRARSRGVQVEAFLFHERRGSEGIPAGLMLTDWKRDAEIIGDGVVVGECVLGRSRRRAR